MIKNDTTLTPKSLEAAAKKVDVEAALTELRSALEGTDLSAVKSATEKVATLSQEMGASLYAASAEQPADESQNTDGVEDAEIVEEK
jgi:molecular chaperone DnaK